MHFLTMCSMFRHFPQSQPYNPVPVFVCLQEESRRLQLQSQMLQQRAMEMSMRVPAGVGGGVGSSTYKQPAAHGVAAASSSSSLAGPAGMTAAAAAAAVVPLSQVSNLQAVMAGVGVVAPGGDAFDGPAMQHQYNMAPVSQANSAMSDGEAAYMAGDGLLQDENDHMLLPRQHAPGDVTPTSSVTSSRAGLHWNIPSRGSMPPSPGKVDAFGTTPSSRGDPRRCVLPYQHEERLRGVLFATVGQ